MMHKKIPAKRHQFDARVAQILDCLYLPDICPLFCSAMLEPGPRYSPVTGVGGPGPGTTGGAADRARMQIADAAAAAAAAHLETGMVTHKKHDLF